LAENAGEYGRCGDDTFYVLYRDHTLQTATRLAEDACVRIASYSWNLLATDLHVTCSIGVADLDWSLPTHDWPIRAALGMKLAKQHGGNQVAIGPVYVPSSISRNLSDHYS